MTGLFLHLSHFDDLSSTSSSTSLFLHLPSQLYTTVNMLLPASMQNYRLFRTVQSVFCKHHCRQYCFGFFDIAKDWVNHCCGLSRQTVQCRPSWRSWTPFLDAWAKLQLVTFGAVGVQCFTWGLAGSNSPGRRRHESEDSAQSAGRQHSVDQLEKRGSRRRKLEIHRGRNNKGEDAEEKQEENTAGWGEVTECTFPPALFPAVVEKN